MKKLDLNHSQRVVLVVGLGAALLALRSWIIHRYDVIGGSEGAWFNYAPNSGVVGGPTFGRSPGSTFALTLVLAAVWIAASLWILRTPAQSTES
jgi:hypothetical protein